MSRPKTEPNSILPYFANLTGQQLIREYIKLANANHEVMCENASVKNALHFAEAHRDHYKELARKYFEANKRAVYGNLVEEEDTFFPSNNQNYDTVKSDGNPDGND